MNEKIRVCGKDLSPLYYILYYILIHLCINDISYCWQPYFPSTHMYHRIGRDVINRFITGQGGKPETGQSQYREGSQKLVNHSTGREARNWSITVQEGSQKPDYHSTGREARNWSITVQGGKPETGQSHYRKGSQKPDYHSRGREARNRIITVQGGKPETGQSQYRKEARNWYITVQEGSQKLVYHST